MRVAVCVHTVFGVQKTHSGVPALTETGSCTNLGVMQISKLTSLMHHQNAVEISDRGVPCNNWFHGRNTAVDKCFTDRTDSESRPGWHENRYRRYRCRYRASIGSVSKRYQTFARFHRSLTGIGPIPHTGIVVSWYRLVCACVLSPLCVFVFAAARTRLNQCSSQQSRSRCCPTSTRDTQLVP
jgi:hypothetical protein